MAAELAEHGIRMNVISIDVTETHQLRYEAELEAEDDPDRTPDDVLREWGGDAPDRPTRLAREPRGRGHVSRQRQGVIRRGNRPQSQW